MAGGQRKKREHVEAPASFPLLRKGIRCVVLLASFPSMSNMWRRKKSPAAANSIRFRAASLLRVASSSLSISQVVSAASSRVQALRLRITARPHDDAQGGEDLDLEAGPASRLDDLEERTKNVEKLADQVGLLDRAACTSLCASVSMSTKCMVPVRRVCGLFGVGASMNGYVRSYNLTRADTHAHVLPWLLLLS